MTVGWWMAIESGLMVPVEMPGHTQAWKIWLVAGYTGFVWIVVWRMLQKVYCGGGCFCLLLNTYDNLDMWLTLGCPCEDLTGTCYWCCPNLYLAVALVSGGQQGHCPLETSARPGKCHLASLFWVPSSVSSSPPSNHESVASSTLWNYLSSLSTQDNRKRWLE